MILTLHGTDVSVFGRRPGTNASMALGLRNMDAVTTVSHSHAVLTRSLFDVPAPCVIPNFVKCRAVSPRPSAWPASPHRPRL